MNEQEAIEYLEEWYLTVPGNKEVSCRVKNHNEALDTAIAALNEVQEYHATGRTPSMVRGLISGYNRARKQCQEATSQLKQYAEIGTPEQCREAVERTRWIQFSEKNPEKYGNYLCCNEYGEYIIGYPEESELEPGRYAVETDECIMYDCVAWLPLPEPYHITNPCKKDGKGE